MTKAEDARRQLGTALALFLRGWDPVSVQCLASGGSEITEWLAETASAQPLKNLILNEAITIEKLRAAQRSHWNAFKHATTRDGRPRDDEAILASFDDGQNETALFVAWWDYWKAGLPRPPEAYAFELWYLSKHLKPHEDAFPGLAGEPPAKQLRRLNRMIRAMRADPEFMEQVDVDPTPLIVLQDL